MHPFTLILYGACGLAVIAATFAVGVSVGRRREYRERLLPTRRRTTR